MKNKINFYEDYKNLCMSHLTDVFKGKDLKDIPMARKLKSTLKNGTQEDKEYLCLLIYIIFKESTVDNVFVFESTFKMAKEYLIKSKSVLFEKFKKVRKVRIDSYIFNIINTLDERDELERNKEEEKNTGRNCRDILRGLERIRLDKGLNIKNFASLIGMKYQIFLNYRHNVKKGFIKQEYVDTITHNLGMTEEEIINYVSVKWEIGYQ